jgi:phosphatidylglycerophosphate synthase
MDAAGRRRLTDAVTLSRVPIAAAMLTARRRPVVLSGLFALGATTDLVDGWLARRLGTSSPRGARLDSTADAAFVAASSVVVATTVDAASRRLVVGAAGVVLATRLATLLLTRRRFATWSVMHTRLNKLAGFGLAGISGAALLRGRMPIAALGAAAVLAELAAIEELAIVVGAGEYDADRASLLDR